MVRERPGAIIRPRAGAVSIGLAACAMAIPALAQYAVTGGDPPGAVQTERSDGSLDVDHAIYYHLHASDLLPEDATAPEHLLRRFMERHTASDYLGAAEAAEELVRLVSDRPIAHYNLACAMARLGRNDRAIEALNDAVACGWRNVGHTERDWDLGAIREDPRYEELINWIKVLIAQEQPPQVPLRTDPLERVLADLDEQAPALLKRYHVPGAAIALLRDGKVVWTGAFSQPADDDAESSDDAPGMTAETIFPSGAPARLSAALSAADDLARNDLSIAHLMVERKNEDVHVHGLNGDGDRARTVGLHEQGDVTALRPAERTARAAALSGEARLPTVMGWPATSVEPASFHLYCVNVESRPNAPTFRDYCTGQVFTPFQLSETSFEIDQTRSTMLVTGHTLLGTPLKHRPPAKSSELICYTSVQDLGRMLEGLMSDAPTAATPGQSAVVNAIQQLSKIVPGAGLGIDAQGTEDGLRVQLAEEQFGAGCLIRWYPETGDGIVIAFNAEAGPPAALRLAGIALGGRR